MSEYGRVLAVSREPRSDLLLEQAVAGATSLEVDDTSDFADNGGLLRITDPEGTTEDVRYLAPDRDLDLLPLENALANTYDEGSEVIPLPVRNHRVAYVQLDDPDSLPIRARVPYAMRQQLPLGIRGDELAEDETEIRAPENVIVDLVGGDWVVRDIVGTETAIEEAGTEAQLIEKSFTIPDAAVVGEYMQLWPIPIDLRFVRVDVVAGDAPSGGDLEMNLRVWDENVNSAAGVFSVDSRLKVPSGENVDSAEIGDLDTTWNVKVVRKREKLGLKVITANGAGAIVVSCVFEPIGPEETEVLALHRTAALAAAADIATSGVVVPP